jgi:hypothetical protein
MLDIDLRGLDNVIRIAEPRDLEGCQNLLQQIGSRKNISQNHLYLNDTTNGFTLVVERDTKLVALSTFTIRKTYQKDKNYSFLYWENLIVDRLNRDGVAYLSIIGYVRKLLRRGEFDDIFFVARRKKALEAHKAARFKTFGYFHLMIKSINFNQKVNDQNRFSCLEYSDFSALFHTDETVHSKSVKEYVGLENSSNIEIQRWLFGKEGKIVLDDFNKRIYFLRSVIKNKFFEVNLFIPSAYTESIPNLSEFSASIVTINLKFTRCFEKRGGIPWYIPKMTYEALCLNEQKLLDDFEIWEHDAW